MITDWDDYYWGPYPEDEPDEFGYHFSRKHKKRINVTDDEYEAILSDYAYEYEHSYEAYE